MSRATTLRNKLKITSAAAFLLSLLAFGTGSAAIGQAYSMYAFDQSQSRYTSGVVSLPGDRSHISVIHPVSLDAGQADYISDSDGFCGPGTSGGASAYGGLIQLKLMHQDNLPAGAAGFESSRNWQVVDCDFDRDGDFDADDLAVDAAPILNELLLTEAYFHIQNTDAVTTADCGPNCQSYIVTTVEVNLDADCDGSVVEHMPVSGAVCFYAEAKPADVGGPAWVGPMEGAISIQGDESRVTFSNSTPTAISLTELGATSIGSQSLPLAIIAVLLLFTAAAAIRLSKRNDLI
jgi:hypothetical protein